jgi:6-phosphogluconolactonase
MTARRERRQRCCWHAFASRSEWEQAAARFILKAAEQSIQTMGAFRMVLAGGETPRRLYQSLRTAATDWSVWTLYFGDERCLPAIDPARNSRMACEAWLDHVAIPPDQIHAIPAELGPELAAAQYSQELAGVDAFDLVLLGLGNDGHTASLFPGGDWERSTTWAAAIPVQDAPKPPAHRVSLSPVRLSRARRVLYLVAGADKRAAVLHWRAGGHLPASRITPAAGVDIFLALGGDIPAPPPDSPAA